MRKTLLRPDFKKVTRKFRVTSTGAEIAFTQETPNTISIMCHFGKSPNAREYTQIEDAIRHYEEWAPFLVDGELEEIHE